MDEKQQMIQSMNQQIDRLRNINQTLREAYGSMIKSEAESRRLIECFRDKCETLENENIRLREVLRAETPGRRPYKEEA